MRDRILKGGSIVYFREVTEPRGNADDVWQIKRWHLEFYPAFRSLKFSHYKLAFSCGIAYVAGFPDLRAHLFYVFVGDKWRGQGYAKTLLLAARERWPTLSWEPAIDEASAGLLKSVGFVDVPKE